MRPKLRSRMPSITGRVMVNMESRLVRITADQASWSILWNQPSRVMPALLTRMSTGPTSACDLLHALGAGRIVADVPLEDGDAGLVLEGLRLLLVAGKGRRHLMAGGRQAPWRWPRRSRASRPSPARLWPSLSSLCSAAFLGGSVVGRRRPPAVIQINRARRTWRCPCRRRCRAWRGPSWRRAASSRRAACSECARPRRRPDGRWRWRRR